MSLNPQEQVTILKVGSLDGLADVQLNSAIATYQTAFEGLPYEEIFTDDEAQSALEAILEQDGDLIIGQNQANEVVALAGGYMLDGGVYFIGDLAVNPAIQGHGLGRTMLQALMKEASRRSPNQLELKTSPLAEVAIKLYKSEGFVLEPTTEVIATPREEGRIILDKRIYLSKIVSEEIEEEVTMELPQSLKRLAIMYPSGNTTAVVFDQVLDAPREELNEQIMSQWKKVAPDKPEIEQCCFVTEPKDSNALARVEMFGGEFCGNATRSVIQLLTKGQDYEGIIEVSGAEKPLEFSVKDGVITLEMPLPSEGDLTEEVDEGTLVFLDGITHLVVTDGSRLEGRTPRQLMEKLLEGNTYGARELPAFGITRYDKGHCKADFAVRVKEVKKIFDETACGSGTCAVGVAAALAAGDNQSLEVIQPSGESIRTEAEIDPDTKSVKVSRISGTVESIYDGRFDLR